MPAIVFLANSSKNEVSNPSVLFCDKIDNIAAEAGE
jgi:hypothetical protein